MALKKFLFLYFKQHPHYKSRLTLYTGLKTPKQYHQLVANAKVKKIKVYYSSIRGSFKTIWFLFKFFNAEDKIFADNFYNTQRLLLQFKQFIGDKQWNYSN